MLAPARNPDAAQLSTVPALSTRLPAVLRRKECYTLSLWLLPFLTFFTGYLGCFFIIQKAPKLVRAALHLIRAPGTASAPTSPSFCPSDPTQSGKVSNGKNAWISACVGA